MDFRGTDDSNAIIEAISKQRISQDTHPPPTSDAPSIQPTNSGPRPIPLLIHAMQILQGQVAQSHGLVQPIQAKPLPQPCNQPNLSLVSNDPFKQPLPMVAANGVCSRKRERSPTIYDGDAIGELRKAHAYNRPPIVSSANTANSGGWQWMESVLPPYKAPAEQQQQQQQSRHGPSDHVPLAEALAGAGIGSRAAVSSSRDTPALQGDPILRYLDPGVLRRLQEQITGAAASSAAASVALNGTLPVVVPVANVPQAGDGDRHMCSCRKSRCLKLYCDCFVNQMFCYGCSCIDCANHEGNLHEVLAARADALARQPNAFQPKVDKSKAEHREGCRCRKSRCLKKYCECFKSGIPCSDQCRCEDCANTSTGPHGRQGPASQPGTIPVSVAADTKEAAVWVDASTVKEESKQSQGMGPVASNAANIDPAGANDKLTVMPLVSQHAIQQESVLSVALDPVSQGPITGTDERPQVALQSTSLQPLASEESPVGTPPSFSTPTTSLGQSFLAQIGLTVVKSLASGSAGSKRISQIVESQARAANPGDLGAIDPLMSQIFQTPAPASRKAMDSEGSRAALRSEPPGFLPSGQGFTLPRPLHTPAASTPLPATPAATLTGLTRRLAGGGNTPGRRAYGGVLAWDERSPQQDLVSPATAFLHKQGNPDGALFSSGVLPVPASATQPKARLDLFPGSSNKAHPFALTADHAPLLGSLRFEPE